MTSRTVRGVRNPIPAGYMVGQPSSYSKSPGAATLVPIPTTGHGNSSSSPNVVAAIASGVASNPSNLTLASGDILVGNASNVAAAVAVSGDATLANTGALTLDTVNTNVGTFQGITVNGKGLATAAVANATLQTTQIATSVAITTSSASLVMMGLGTTAVSGAGTTTVITPKTSGKIFVSVCFTGQLATGTDYASAQIAYGTGSPPTGGHAGTGTGIGSSATWGNTNAAGNVPYFMVTLTALITGAALSTALWIDIGWLNGVGARAIDAYNLSVSAYEV